MKHIIWILVEGTEYDVLAAHQTLRYQAMERHDREYGLSLTKDVMPAGWGQIGVVEPYKYTCPPGFSDTEFNETPRPMPFSDALALLLDKIRDANADRGYFVEISPGDVWLLLASAQTY